MRRFALFLSIALVAASAPALVPAASSAQAPSSATAPEPPSAPGQLLVGYDIGTSASERAEARGEAGARRLEDVVDGSGSRQAVELVALPAGADRSAAIRRFERNPNVAYAEPNWIVTHQAESDDPYYADNQLWGAYGDTTTPANQYGSQAGEVWGTANTGAGVVIGVIDTGVDIDHPDLDANIWKNPGEVAGDGVDNDGNGYADDVNGWDFHNGDASVYDPADGDKHGTHVAGTVAAERNNSTGVVGVAPDTKIIPVKFLGPSGGYTSNAVKAVDYLTGLKTKHGINLVASNNSWGGGGYNKSLYAAIERANTANVLFVAAAGNKGTDNDATPHYPSSYDNTNVVAVASTTSSGAKSSFSNYGDVSVDLGAPGSGIWSTLPGSTYGSYNGTSMATPHVTGGVALAAAKWPNHTGAQLRSAVLGAVVPTASMEAQTVTGGRLDVSSFTGTTAVVEDPPATNTAPVAHDDRYSVSEDTSLTVPASGVLGNDEDGDGDALAAVLVSSPISGVLSLGGDGSFTYTPAADFFGTVSFTYQAADAEALSNTAMVNIDVTDVAEPPAADTTSSATIDGLWFGGKKNNNHLDVRAIVTAEGQPVSGATVTAVVGGLTRTATTDSSGIALLASYRSPSGCIDAAITAVTASPSWDGTKDSETLCRTTTSTK